mmetsp:Transcript_38271/g.120492  ORF Transcript_38271/g.120492 Transcript_38271/m.120492 type:complete len:207 (+) Transcript_38271:268-888(+)
MQDQRLLEEPLASPHPLTSIPLRLLHLLEGEVNLGVWKYFPRACRHGDLVASAELGDVWAETRRSTSRFHDVKGTRLEAVGHAEFHRNRADVEGALPEDEGPVVRLHPTRLQLLVVKRVAPIHSVADRCTLLAQHGDEHLPLMHSCWWLEGGRLCPYQATNSDDEASQGPSVVTKLNCTQAVVGGIGHEAPVSVLLPKHRQTEQQA